MARVDGGRAGGGGQGGLWSDGVDEGFTGTTVEAVGGGGVVLIGGLQGMQQRYSISMVASVGIKGSSLADRAIYDCQQQLTASAEVNLSNVAAS